MRDDIIRKFLDLHPDTPIDDKQYAVPLWVIHRMLETAEAAEREACADITENWRCNGMPRTVLADQIRARGRSEALTNLNKAAEDIGQEL